MTQSLIIKEQNFQSDSLTKENIVVALRDVIDPEIGTNIYDLGFIRDIQIKNDGEVLIGLLLTTPNCPLIKELQNAIIWSDQNLIRQRVSN